MKISDIVNEQALPKPVDPTPPGRPIKPVADLIKQLGAKAANDPKYIERIRKFWALSKMSGVLAGLEFLLYTPSLNDNETAEIERIKALDSLQSNPSLDRADYEDLEDAFGPIVEPIIQPDPSADPAPDAPPITKPAPRTLPEPERRTITQPVIPIPQQPEVPGIDIVPQPTGDPVPGAPNAPPITAPEFPGIDIVPQSSEDPIARNNPVPVPPPAEPPVAEPPILRPNKTKKIVPVVPDLTTKTPTTPVPKQNVPLLRQQIKNFKRSPSGQTVLQYEDAQLNEKTYTKAQYADLVRKYSKAYNVPPALAMHVLNRETGIYDPNKAASIISRAGAVGPMQLMPQYSKDFGIRQQDLTDPTKNIEAGVRNLAKQFERFKGNPQHALMAYNWGPTATAKWLAKGGKGKIPQETYDYIYGSKDKNWAPYSNDIEQQITTYLGPDDAQAYLTKMNTSNTSVLQKKYNDFTNKLSSLKTDAMATGSGTDTAAIAGAGNTGELPDIVSPSTPAPRPQIQGGPIWDKAKELGTAALNKVRDLNKSTSIQDTIKQKYNNFIGQNKTVEPVKEKAPPGDKYERMIKDIKKGYAKDGKLTNTERSIAYATAWKLYNKRKGKKS